MPCDWQALKQELAGYGADYAGCSERQELIDLLLATRHQQATACAAMATPVDADVDDSELDAELEAALAEEGLCL